MVDYESVRGRMKTGDVLLFAGEDWVSRGIRRVTGGPWSHVAMVVVVEPAAGSRMVAAWESTTLSAVPDLETGELRKGVSLVPLSSRVASVRGRLAWRALSAGLTPTMEAALWAVRQRLSRTPYERDWLELWRSAYDGPMGANREALASVFCSELVAEAYQAMGLLRDVDRGGLPSNEYTPRDFSTSARVPLRFERGYALSEEVEIATGAAASKLAG